MIDAEKLICELGEGETSYIPTCQVVSPPTREKVFSRYKDSTYFLASPRGQFHLSVDDVIAAEGYARKVTNQPTLYLCIVTFRRFLVEG